MPSIPDAPGRITRTSLKVGPLLFSSGLCALIYQVAWQREFRLIFGASTAASAAVLAIFIGGLGAGGLALGARVDRSARPLSFYGRLEIAIAISAGLSPLLFRLVRAGYLALGGVSTLGATGATLVRLLFATLVLAVPTTLMGGTLPAVSRAVSTSDDRGRRALALLYGINTLGAVAGALVSTFFMLEIFGTRLTLVFAATLNLLVGVLANALGRNVDPLPKDEAQESASEAEAAAAEEPRPPAWFTLAASGIVGFAFFLMELVWYRMLAPLLGGTVFTFGLILAQALLGIGLGGGCYALVGRGRPARVRGFAYTCLAEAACIAVAYGLGDRLAIVALQLRPVGALGLGGHVAAWVFITSIVVVPAAFVAGVQFPMLIALLGQGRRAIGRQVGLTYAANTVGAIVGALAGGFGLLPALSAPGCWRLVVVVLVVLGAVAVALELARGASRRAGLGPALIAALAFVLIRATGPTAAWRHSSIGAGRATPTGTPNDARAWMRDQRRMLVWEEDGRESSVALITTGGISFVVNGKVDGAAIGDSQTQVMAGVLGPFLLPHAKRAIVVGMGTGSSAGWLAMAKTIERVDVVELEPAILHVARVCSPVNAGVLDNPKVHTAINDAREVLLTTRETYDIVLSEPSNPYRAGIASLYTEEFYRAAAGRLAEGGVFMQWTQAYEIDGETVRTIYRTLGSVFPHIETWRMKSADLLLVASFAPIAYDVDALRKRLLEEPYKTAFASTWRVSELEGALAHYVGNADLARQLAAEGAPMNTDDVTPIEFGFARTLGASRVDVHGELRALAVASKHQRPNVPDAAIDWNKVNEARHVVPFAEAREPPPGKPLGPGPRERQAARAAFLRGELREALAAWRAQPDPPLTWPDTMMLAEVTADVGEEEQALAYVEKLRAYGPADLDGVMTRLHLRKGRLREAREAGLRALARYRIDPWVWQASSDHTITALVELATRDRESLAPVFDALGAELVLDRDGDARLNARATLGKALSPRACADAVSAYEPSVPWSFDFLVMRSVCYEKVGDPRAALAARELTQFLAREPAHVAAPGATP